MAVLVTGGAGFIGSHTCVELLRRGHDVVLADDHSNSSPAAVAAIREVSGRDLAVHQVDVRDKSALVADPGRAEKLWGWRTSRDLQAMCRDAWRFQRLHPRGYQGGE